MLILAWIIAGIVAGWVTARLMKGGGQRARMELVSGMIGGLLGGWIMRSFGTAPGAGMVSSTWIALLGGFVLTVLLRVRGRIPAFPGVHA